MEYGLPEIAKLLNRGIAGLAIKNPMPWKDVWKKEYDAICIHTRGNYPKNLEAAFPNEGKASKKWRFENQQAVTMSYFVNWIVSFSICILQSKFSFSRSTPEFDAKIAEFKQDGLSYWQFINKRAFHRRVEDPNGLAVILPKNTIALTAKDAGSPEIYIELVNSKDICFQNDDLLVFECSQKSVVLVPDKDSDNPTKFIESYTGCIYYILTKDWYYAYQQKGEKSKNDYELISVYKHNLGEIPAKVFGGIPTLWEGKIDNYYTKKEICKEYFHSDLFPAVAHANVALGDFYILQCNKNRVSFPIIQVPETKCNNPVCVKGQIIIGGNDNTSGATEPCGFCHGKGTIAWPVPTEGISVTPVVKNFAGDITNGGEIKIIDVNPNNVNVISEQYEKANARLNECLNMLFTEQAQSGVAKEKDKEDRDAAILNFIDYWYDVLNTDLLNWMNRIWHLKTENEIALNKPISVKIETTAELADEYKNIVDTGIVTGIRNEAYSDYVQKRFSGDTIGQKCEAVAMLYDPLYLVSESEKKERLAINITDSRKVQISNELPTVIRRIAVEMGTDAFDSAEPKAIIARLDAEFKKSYPIVIKESSGSEEAQNRLRALSGGVDSQVQITAAVARGEMSPSSAIALLMEAFGYDLPTATQIAGEPVKKLEAVEPAATAFPPRKTPQPANA